MASSSSLSLLHPPLIRRSATVHCLPPPLLLRRRRSLSLLLLLSSSAATASILSFTAPPSKAEDIPLFGLRKKLKEVEQEAAEIVKEGEEAVEKVAEQEIAEGLGLGIAGDLVQAGAVAGAEAVGVLVGVSVVNGILGPEGK